MTKPGTESAGVGVDRRRRLFASLQGRPIESVFGDEAIRADLEAEARGAALDGDRLISAEILDHLRELIAARAALESSEGGTIAEGKPADGADRRLECFFSTEVALIVPGLLASGLHDRGEAGLGRIWLDPGLYFRERLSAMKLAAYDGRETDLDPRVRIEAAGGLPILYDLLRLALECRRYATELFAVDWRKDVELAAARLEGRLRVLGRDARPVHLVAHSQGALVARRALQRLGEREARRIVRNLVLIGPANFGSFSAALGLSGGGELIRLARRFAVEPADGFQSVAATFTSLYQLLPFDADRVPWLRSHNLGDPAFWPKPVDETRLLRFRGWARSIDSTFFDERTTVLLGEAARTSGGLTRSGETWIDSPADALPGDGTVPHSCSVLPKTRSYLAVGVEHALMTARRPIIDAVVDALAGRAPRLIEVSSDYRDHLGRGPFTDSLVVHPLPARELKVSSTVAGEKPRLNGKFLTDYDGERALPEDPDLAELFRRQELQDELAAEAIVAGPLGSVDEERSLQSASTLAGRSYDASLSSNPQDSCFELILDASNLLPFDFLRTGDRLGRAVVKIERGDGAAGTGFLVAPDILLTNHHVLPDVESAASATALANYEVNPADDRSGRTATVPLAPQTLFVSNADLDFTFCAVVGLEYLGAVPLTRNSLNVLSSEYINIIQHPRGRPKEVALQDNRVVRADNLVLQYSCDTEPGSSGSPVFNNQWKLVALHHASVRTDNPEGRRSLGGDSHARYLNEGVRLSAIAAWLETSEANRPDRREAVERLRRVFHGLDSQIGFFGALGRRSRGRSATEIVVEIYRGGCDDLDLVYWNLAGFALELGANLDDLARAVAEMNMDVWCLANISPASAQALRRRLQTVYRLDYALQGVSTAEGTAILRRRREGLSIAGGPAFAVRAISAKGCAFDFVLEFAGRLGAGDSSSGSRASEAGAGRLIVGSPGEWDRLGSRGIAADSIAGGLAPIAVGSAIDGFVAIVPDRRAAIDQVFASPNLRLLFGSEDRVVFTRDRDFPDRLLRQGRGRPVAVRLSLPCSSTDSAAEPLANPCGERCRHPDAPAPLAESVVPCGSKAGLDEGLLERKLREMIGPLLNRMIAERLLDDSASGSA